MNSIPADLPRDQLLRYAQAVGLAVGERTPDDELRRMVRERVDLIDALDRDTLIELVKWTRRAVHEDAGKEELAREISASRKMAFEGLSRPALYALARLRSLPAAEADSPEALLRKLRKAERLIERLRRRWREWLGGVIGRMLFGGDGGEPPEEYRFLPPDKRPASLREDVAERGLIGGLADRLRGVADDYVREKLDEIERRIDRKLEEIDRRLGEWRDREIANRLRIMKVTLLASVIVALLSLAYNAINRMITAGS
jgi:hypothetical protein